MKTTRHVIGSSARLVALAMILLPVPAGAQLQLSSPDGKQSFKIGILGQLQAESVDNPGGAGTATNLFIRRLRVIGGFKLNDKLTVFVETDDPNLGKANALGVKNNSNVFIQDFAVSYAFSTEFTLDGGLLLLEQDYNHNQSAATLMSVDYGPFTFIESAPLSEVVGRDYGLRARGYLGDDHFEYRVGIYQGLRGPDSNNALRTVGRFSYWFLGPQKGLFYRGCSFGTTQSMELGASYDLQKDYRAIGGDFYWDQPVAGGDGLTLQADYVQSDGREFIPAISKQRDSLVEVGYYIHSLKLLPYVQYAKQDFSEAANADEQRTQVGVAYAIEGHNSNLKLAYTDINLKGAERRNQFQIQFQVFAF